MALFDFNALSVILGGSFAARVFLPEMDKLQLDDSAHAHKYPVLVLLHDEGGASVDWQRTPVERLAAEHGIFVIAPDVQHTLGTDMEYGPKYETFVSTELLNICCNIFPIAQDSAQTWVGGVGTGGYGAVKLALHHPEVFSKAFSIDGVLDLGAVIEKVEASEDTGICLGKAQLEAIFSDYSHFSGGTNDLFTLVKQPTKGKFLFVCEEGFCRQTESETLARQLGAAAEIATLPAGADCMSQQKSLPQAVAWARA
jgi:S-formylglutathione hydrolase FrmB